VYAISLGLIPLITEKHVAYSMAAATGVANGGIVVQVVTLFPIWAPLIIFWAHSNKSPNFTPSAEIG